MRYRLVPARRSTAGPWYRAWSADSATAAVALAQDFYMREGIPVLITEDPFASGPVRVLGVFTDRKLRCDRKRRK